MDNDQKAYIYLDSKGVLQKAGDIDGLFSKAHVRVTLKDTVLKMEPVDNFGTLDQQTVYFKNTFFDPQFLIFVLSYLQNKNVHGIALAKIGDEYIDTKSSDEQLREIIDDLDTTDFVKPAKDYSNVLDMIAESPLYNSERTITEDKNYQENMKAISKIYKGICEKGDPKIYSDLEALTDAYEGDMLSVIYKIAFKQGYLVAMEMYQNLYNNQNTDFEVFEFDEDDDEWF